MLIKVHIWPILCNSLSSLGTVVEEGLKFDTKDKGMGDKGMNTDKN